MLKTTAEGDHRALQDALHGSERCLRQRISLVGEWWVSSLCQHRTWHRGQALGRALLRAQHLAWEYRHGWAGFVGWDLGRPW